MKRILAIILCVMLMGALPVVALAEEVEPTVEENIPPIEDVVTEDASEAEKTMTDIIVEYVKGHIEEIFVIVGTALFGFYEGVVRKKMNGSIGTLNNNAITIATDSAKAIKDSLTEVKGIAEIIKGYKEEFSALLGEVRKNAEDKQSLEDTLSQVATFLKSAKLANLELSNEVAELLVLANIPNSKKEELYSRHTKAVHDLEVVEKEVINNDGEKA